MESLDLTKPGERRKVIWAGVLGLIAVLVLWWVLFGFGSRSTPTRTSVASQPAATPSLAVGQRRAASTPDEQLTFDLKEISYPGSVPSVPEPRRNIFAYYEPPKPVGPVAAAQTPTPAPPPPILLASVTPSNLYARTADFVLEANGDKFTPDSRITIDNRELPTKFRGPQQLSADVSAAMIANPGLRQVVVRTPDNRLFSNSLPLTISPPPVPNYTYVGILSTVPRVDIGYLQDRSSKDVLSVQRGDLLGGRFRVTSISEKEIVLVDTSLKIRHALSMTEGEKGASSPLTRPTPKVDAEDDEP